MGHIRIIKRQRLLLKIQHVHPAAQRIKSIADVSDDCASHGVPMQAADHRQHVQRHFWHAAKVPNALIESNKSGDLSFQTPSRRITVSWLLLMEVPDSFYSVVENVCRDLYIQSLKEIPPDIVEAIRQAASRETKEVAKRIFSHYIQSIELGQTKDMIVCQDTGIPIYWVNIGGNLRIDGAKLTEAITRGTERATKEHPLRSSIVSPLQRENRQTSTGERIPIIHYDFAADSDVLDILFMPKGSGSENMSFMKMLLPADGVNGIKRFVLEQVVGAGAKPCPPTIVGIGIGGSSDLCMTLAKKAIARPLGSKNPDAQMAALETELFDAINQTGIGPQGLGGNTTALAVHIESAWTHITCNPVAVNMQCWRAERRRAKISPDGKVELGF